MMTGYLKAVIPILMMFLVLSLKAQNKEVVMDESNNNTGSFELFGEKLPPGVSWTKDEEYVRNGGNTDKSNYYLYIDEPGRNERALPSYPGESWPGRISIYYLFMDKVGWGTSRDEIRP